MCCTSVRTGAGSRSVAEQSTDLHYEPATWRPVHARWGAPLGSRSRTASIASTPVAPPTRTGGAARLRGWHTDLQPDQIFFSIDATPIGALQEDPAQIFLDPYALDEPDLERAVREMLTRDEGVVNYRFRGKERTVLYRRSPVSNWWYAFGHVWD